MTQYIYLCYTFQYHQITQSLLKPISYVNSTLYSKIIMVVTDAWLLKQVTSSKVTFTHNTSKLKYLKHFITKISGWHCCRSAEDNTCIWLSLLDTFISLLFMPSKSAVFKHHLKSQHLSYVDSHTRCHGTFVKQQQLSRSNKTFHKLIKHLCYYCLSLLKVLFLSETFPSYWMQVPVELEHIPARSCMRILALHT